MAEEHGLTSPFPLVHSLQSLHVPQPLPLQNIVVSQPLSPSRIVTEPEEPAPGEPDTRIPIWFCYEELVDKLMVAGQTDVSELRGAIKKKLTPLLDAFASAQLLLHKNGAPLPPSTTVGDIGAEGTSAISPLHVQHPGHSFSHYPSVMASQNPLVQDLHKTMDKPTQSTNMSSTFGSNLLVISENPLLVLKGSNSMGKPKKRKRDGDDSTQRKKRNKRTSVAEALERAKLARSGAANVYTERKLQGAEMRLLRAHEHFVKTMGLQEGLVAKYPVGKPNGKTRSLLHASLIDILVLAENPQSGRGTATGRAALQRAVAVGKAALAGRKTCSVTCRSDTWEIDLDFIPPNFNLAGRIAGIEATLNAESVQPPSLGVMHPMGHMTMGNMGDLSAPARESYAHYLQGDARPGQHPHSSLSAPLHLLPSVPANNPLDLHQPHNQHQHPHLQHLQHQQHQHGQVLSHTLEFGPPFTTHSLPSFNTPHGQGASHTSHNFVDNQHPLQPPEAPQHDEFGDASHQFSSHFGEQSPPVAQFSSTDYSRHQFDAPSSQAPFKYEAGKYDPGKYDPGKYDPGKYDPGKYDSQFTQYNSGGEQRQFGQSSQFSAHAFSSTSQVTNGTSFDPPSFVGTAQQEDVSSPTTPIGEYEASGAPPYGAGSTFETSAPFGSPPNASFGLAEHHTSVQVQGRNVHVD